MPHEAGAATVSAHVFIPVMSTSIVVVVAGLGPAMFSALGRGDAARSDEALMRPGEPESDESAPAKPAPNATGREIVLVAVGWPEHVADSTARMIRILA